MEPVYDKGRRAFLIHGGSGSGNFGHGGRPGYEGGSAPGGEEIEPDPNIGTKVKEGHIPTTPLDKSPSMGEKPHPGAGDYTPKMHGGPGSGNFGHEGRPGERGGSAPGGGGGPQPKSPEPAKSEYDPKPGSKYHKDTLKKDTWQDLDKKLDDIHTAQQANYGRYISKYNYLKSLDVPVSQISEHEDIKPIIKEGESMARVEKRIVELKMEKDSDPVEKGGPGSGEFGKLTPDEVRRAETKITYHGTEDPLVEEIRKRVGRGEWRGKE